MIVIAFHVVPFITRSERGECKNGRNYGGLGGLRWPASPSLYSDFFPTALIYRPPTVLGAVFCELRCCNIPFEKNIILFASCAPVPALAGFLCSARRYWSPFKLINFKCDF